MKYHPLTDKIKKLLTQNKYWFETFEHEPVRTSEKAAKIRTGYTINQGAKALILRIKKSKKEKYFVMLVFPAHLKFNSNKVRKLLEAKDMRFGTKEEVSQITDGVQFGAIPPFGNLFDLKVIVDPKLFENEKIVFNAGDRKLSIGMKSEDYKNLVSPKISSIT